MFLSSYIKLTWQSPGSWNNSCSQNLLEQIFLIQLFTLDSNHCIMIIFDLSNICLLRLVDAGNSRRHWLIILLIVGHKIVMFRAWTTVSVMWIKRSKSCQHLGNGPGTQRSGKIIMVSHTSDPVSVEIILVLNPNDLCHQLHKFVPYWWQMWWWYNCVFLQYG